nr:DUF4398 domain-containing protein [Marinobacter santoriniensis]
MAGTVKKRHRRKPEFGRADARELIDQEQYVKAQRLLEEATVDAQLAAARSQTERAQQAVAEINRNIENLQNRLEMDEQ